MEYYITLKKKGILSFATTQLNLEGTMLSGIIQTKTDKYCMVSFFYVESQKCKEQNGSCQGGNGEQAEAGESIQTFTYKMNNF